MRKKWTKINCLRNRLWLTGPHQNMFSLRYISPFVVHSTRNGNLLSCVLLALPSLSQEPDWWNLTSLSMPITADKLSCNLEDPFIMLTLLSDLTDSSRCGNVIHCWHQLQFFPLRWRGTNSIVFPRTNNQLPSAIFFGYNDIRMADWGFILELSLLSVRNLHHLLFCLVEPQICCTHTLWCMFPSFSSFRHENSRVVCFRRTRQQMRIIILSRLIRQLTGWISLCVLCCVALKSAYLLGTQLPWAWDIFIPPLHGYMKAN